MTWIIVVLLALILVALMSSNQGSAQGVKKAIKFAAVSAIVLIVWLLFVVVLIWAQAFDGGGPWSLAVMAGIGILMPPTIVWINRKEIRTAFKENPRQATKTSVKIVGYVGLGLAVMIVFHLLKKEGLDSLVLLCLFIVTGAVLIGRTRYRWNEWSEVWIGPKQPPQIWPMMDKARKDAYEADRVIWEKESAQWETRSEAEQAEITAVREHRARETDERLQLLEASLNAQWDNWNKRGVFSIRYVFWLTTLALVFQMAVALWDYLIDRA